MAVGMQRFCFMLYDGAAAAEALSQRSVAGAVCCRGRGRRTGRKEGKERGREMRL